VYDRQKFTDLIVHPLGTFLIISISIVAFYKLRFPPSLQLKVYKYPLQQVLLSLAIAVQVLAFTWLVLRIIDFIASLLEQKAAETPSPATIS
jgi:MscS family membrane protein